MLFAELIDRFDLSENWYFDATPKGFDLARLTRIVWGAQLDGTHRDFGALCLDADGWFWYLRGTETRSAAWMDSTIEVIGPVDASRAFGPFFVPRHHREEDFEAAEAWVKARREFIEDGDE